MEYIFWTTLFLAFHAYFGYPLSLWFISCFKSNTTFKAPIEPYVSLIITACNEERRIKEKMENTIAIEYPREKLQVLVASDGSTDGTNEIVNTYSERGIELLPFLERRGKENAQKDAVSKATGEIIIFSDVATIIDPGGLRTIVANFADPTVGCVSSVDRVIGQDGKPCGEGAYVTYEMWLRNLESKVSSLVGLSGSFFAARMEVCRDFSGEMQSDFRTVLNSMRLGLRGISDSESIGYYQDISDNSREFGRKVRTVLRGLTVFFRNLEFLNVFRYGIFSYQYFCHKLLRWLVPFLLIFVLAVNTVLASGGLIYAVLLILQLVFYIIALTGWIGKAPSLHFAVKIPLYFTTVNAAILVAWWRFLRGKKMVMWSPSQR
jgi:cellulose synthase/poly-beta-1,6-N-acetylglucosamine synthase-like glycosyltransferase